MGFPFSLFVRSDQQQIKIKSTPPALKGAGAWGGEATPSSHPEAVALVLGIKNKIGTPSMKLMGPPRFSS